MYINLLAWPIAGTTNHHRITVKSKRSFPPYLACSHPAVERLTTANLPPPLFPFPYPSFRTHARTIGLRYRGDVVLAGIDSVSPIPPNASAFPTQRDSSQCVICMRWVDVCRRHHVIRRGLTATSAGPNHASWHATMGGVGPNISIGV